MGFNNKSAAKKIPCSSIPADISVQYSDKRLRARNTKPLLINSARRMGQMYSHLLNYQLPGVVHLKKAAMKINL